MSEGKRSEWQELCAAAVTEPDSKKLADLVDQLLEALDRRGRVLSLPNGSCNKP
jgi:hypothetical protein